MRILSGDNLSTFESEQIGAASQVARFVVFEDIRTVAMMSRLNLSECVTKSAQFKVDVTAAYTLDSDSRYIVTLPFRVALSKMGESECAVASFDVEYQLKYKLLNAPPDEHRDRYLVAFAQINGVFNAWPFLRETIHGLAGRMSLLVPTLPVLRVLATPKPSPVKPSQVDGQESAAQHP